MFDRREDAGWGHGQRGERHDAGASGSETALAMASPTPGLPSLKSPPCVPRRANRSPKRIVSLDRGSVRVRWKDDADGDRVKVMALKAEERGGG